MNIKAIPEIKTEEEAKQQAVEWQKYVSENNLDADIQEGMSIEDARSVVIDELKDSVLQEKIEEIQGMECLL